MYRLFPFAVLALLAGPASASPAFPGTLDLAIDATDVDHAVFSVHETIPVTVAGDVTLLYPQWEIGSHAPTASVADLAGLIVSVDGRRVDWRRDPLDVHAFHVPVPAGAARIEVDFQFLSPASAKWMRPDMIGVQWHRMLLYPAGWNVRDIPIAARLKLPSGLHDFSALSGHDEGDWRRFAPTSLESLVDAPLYAARYWSRVYLAKDADLDLLADNESDLAISPEETQRLKRLFAQAGKLLGPAPFSHYDAIVTLSADLPPGGIEHLQEGEDFLPADYFIDPAHQLENRDLIAHELVHAWNGRFRQPADLQAPDYNHPQGGSLLWVYEGQSEFWGRVLAARAGLRSPTETLDRVAVDAALVANRPGRAWKSLADSGNDAIYMAGHGTSWRDWQRREDYYPEGVLLWLDVEARLRETSDGKKGLDDFARQFFQTSAAYRFEDVCAALDAVAHDDWPTFLRRHLDSHDDADILAGLARAGWRLVYDADPSETFRQTDGADDLSYSIGLHARDNGILRSVVWGGPAFKAGLAPGAKIRLVNDALFTNAALISAVGAGRALVLDVEIAGSSRKVTIPYDGGLRYPRLERIPGTTDWLSPLLAQR